LGRERQLRRRRATPDNDDDEHYETKDMPEDAKEAFGHGVRAKRSKSGAIRFELLALEAGHASLQ
jgi:hypothetical protein